MYFKLKIIWCSKFSQMKQELNIFILKTRRVKVLSTQGTPTTTLLATDLCLSWPKVLNLVTVRGLMKTLV